MADDTSDCVDFVHGEIVGYNASFPNVKMARFARILNRTSSAYGSELKWHIYAPPYSGVMQVAYQWRLFKLTEDQQEDYIMARLEGREYLEI